MNLILEQKVAEDAKEARLVRPLLAEMLLPL